MITAEEALHLAKKLLGEQGEDLVTKINNVIQMISDLSALLTKRIVFYAVCDTAANTQTKEVTISGITELYTGLHVRVKFTNNQNYNGTPYLKINSLDAKDIRQRESTYAARYEWDAGSVIDVVYDGAHFLEANRNHATTTFYGVTQLYTGAGYSGVDQALTPRSLKNFGDGVIAPYFSDTSTYAVGDRVRCQNNIYECSTAITTPEQWTISHWTQLPTLQEQVDAKPDLSSTATDIKMDGTQSAGSSTKAAKADHVHPSDTSKLDVTALNLFDVVTPSFSSLPKTFYSTKLTSLCKLVGNAIELSVPKAGDIDWSVSFANGSLTISGTFHGSTATTASMSIWLPTETITLTTS